MACFLVPVAEAIITTAVTKAAKSKETESAVQNNETDSSYIEAGTKISFTRKLKWLTNMLWGGSVLLAFEHVWHGEVVPWFPFLTAASNPADATAMLHEMSTVGVSMAVLVTAVWAVMVLVTNSIEKKVIKAQSEPALN